MSKNSYTLYMNNKLIHFIIFHSLSLSILYCVVGQVYRLYSSGSNTPPAGGSGGFFKTFFENLRKSMEKDKEMQDSLKAFEEERSRIVKSDSVKLFRQQLSDTKVSGKVSEQVMV